VLLKNDNRTLPLDRRRLKTLAVIGPNAKGVHLGGYSRDPGRKIDVLAGIQTSAGPDVRVRLRRRRAASPSTTRTGMRDKVVLGDPEKNRARIKDGRRVRATGRRDRPRHRHQRVHVARGVVRFASRRRRRPVAHEPAERSARRDGRDGQAGRRRAGQRPADGDPEVAARVPAILETWYAGQEGGTAIGEVLFGDVNPGGKLPVTFPRHSGQLPVYYNRRPTSFRPGLDLPREPLWPFGFGLSYTTFKLSNLKIDQPSIGIAVARPSSAWTVTNTGDRAGDEVVQLYIRDVVSSVTRPSKELRGFERVTLAPGETRP
jgi:beta-glucosidase